LVVLQENAPNENSGIASTSLHSGCSNFDEAVSSTPKSHQPPSGISDVSSVSIDPEVNTDSILKKVLLHLKLQI